MQKLWIALAVAGLCAGCVKPRDKSYFVEPKAVEVTRQGPADADDGTCWAQDETPAVVETITQQIVQTPAKIAEDGTVLTPATYRTVTQQRIVESRDDIWFRTPCDTELTEDYVAALQRAMRLRGIYAGDITGTMDAETQRAIRILQKPQGLNSPKLSLVAARKLGLVAYSRDEIAKF